MASDIWKYEVSSWNMTGLLGAVLYEDSNRLAGSIKDAIENKLQLVQFTSGLGELTIWRK